MNLRPLVDGRRDRRCRNRAARRRRGRRVEPSAPPGGACSVIAFACVRPDDLGRDVAAVELRRGGWRRRQRGWSRNTPGSSTRSSRAMRGLNASTAVRSSSWTGSSERCWAGRHTSRTSVGGGDPLLPTNGSCDVRRARTNPLYPPQPGLEDAGESCAPTSTSGAKTR